MQVRILPAHKHGSCSACNLNSDNFMKNKLIESFCLNCGTVFMARLSDVKRGVGGDFCSRTCKNSGKYNPHYKGGQLSNYEYKLRAIQKNPQRFLAMQEVQTAVRNGTLVKPNHCEICPETKIEAHHTDYTKPLNVQWLCRYHHDKAHHG